MDYTDEAEKNQQGMTLTVVVLFAKCFVKQLRSYI